MLFRIVTILSFIAIVGMPNPAATPPANPYEAEFAAARAETTNPMQLAILEDNDITPEEYEVAVNAFMTCMAQNGYPDLWRHHSALNPALPEYMWTPLRDDPTRTLTEDDYAAFDRQFDECSREWKSQVEMLYGSVIANPNNEDWDVITLACLQRTGVLPEAFTLDQYRAAWNSGSWPDGVNMFSDEFAACVANPTNPVTEQHD